MERAMFTFDARYVNSTRSRSVGRSFDDVYASSLLSNYLIAVDFFREERASGVKLEISIDSI